MNKVCARVHRWLRDTESHYITQDLIWFVLDQNIETFSQVQIFLTLESPPSPCFYLSCDIKDTRAPAPKRFESHTSFSSSSGTVKLLILSLNTYPFLYTSNTGVHPNWKSHDGTIYEQKKKKNAAPAKTVKKKTPKIPKPKVTSFNVQSHSEWFPGEPEGWFSTHITSYQCGSPPHQHQTNVTHIHLHC